MVYDAGADCLRKGLPGREQSLENSEIPKSPIKLTVPLYGWVYMASFLRMLACPNLSLADPTSVFLAIYLSVPELLSFQ
jgi:hypothetical protein